MPAKHSIFISYRRSDSDYVTSHIYEKLRSHFGPSLVFKDTDSIPLGQDFRQYIAEAIDASQVVIAVIGKRWLDTLEEREVEGTHDYVKQELETALEKKNIPVIPVLVEGVQMPDAQDLPESIRELVYRNAAQVRPAVDFDQDVERLIAGLEAVIGPPLEALESESNPETQRQLSDITQVKLEALEAQKAVSLEKYKAASFQLSGTLSEADKVMIRAQIKNVEQEIEKICAEISALFSQ